MHYVTFVILQSLVFGTNALFAETGTCVTTASANPGYAQARSHTASASLHFASRVAHAHYFGVR